MASKPIDKLGVLIDKLSRGPKPRTRTTLSNTIKALFLQNVTDLEIDEIVSEMINSNRIEIHDNKITYLNIDP